MTQRRPRPLGYVFRIRRALERAREPRRFGHWAATPEQYGLTGAVVWNGVEYRPMSDYEDKDNDE
jgi:hypothetical protein